MNTHDRILKCRSCGYVGPCNPPCCDWPDYDGATAEEAWAAAIEADRQGWGEPVAWRPIETAPQGQLALFYDANAVEVRSCMFVDWMVGGAFCGNRHHIATHWMPLPAAPGALSGESHD